MYKKKVVLITGASAGIGLATAKYLIENGHAVYAAARRVEKMKELVAMGGKILEMDVTNNESMEKGIKQIIHENGYIDVLINNAGYGSLGAVEEVDMDEARRQFEVNVFGSARLSQLVIPHMRSRNEGRIVNISSVGARIYEPLSAWYHSTKFALEGLSDCMRLELKQFGIAVVIVQPGFIRTEWDAVAHDNLKKFSFLGPYQALATKLANTHTNFMFKYFASDAERAARTIVRSVQVKKPRGRYVCGKGARTFLLARKIFTDRILDRVLLTVLNIFGSQKKVEKVEQVSLN
jgi:NAD(P)-dependent dehydrogenase (short-subunit alcohol dehydrogenase family)